MLSKRMAQISPGQARSLPWRERALNQNVRLEGHTMHTVQPFIRDQIPNKL
jgi:hypothetical protein